MKKTTTEDFVAACKAKHPDKNYDYSLIHSFPGMKERVTVICPLHGQFEIQALKHHYRGDMCPGCTKVARKTRLLKNRHLAPATNRARCAATFIERSRAVHDDFFDYSQTIYVGARQDVTIICPKHGPFIQKASKHLAGRGCWDCGQKSAAEKDLAAFVTSLAPDAVRRDRTVIKPKEVDVWVPSAKLALEYCGHYYHSTLKLSLAAARAKHLAKHRAAGAAGIRLLTIFADEWASRRPQVEALIRRAVLPEAGVGARKCAVTNDGDFRAFYDANHIQGAPQWGTHRGLTLDGELVAAMTFGRGSARRGATDWELVRYATSRNVVGGASRLFRALLAETGAERVWSFSDNRYFGGGMYEKLGFVLDDELAPDYSIVRAGERAHKRTFARSAIPSRVREVESTEIFDPATDRRSEWDMTQLLGYGRIYDCGKKRWLWTSHETSALTAL